MLDQIKTKIKEEAQRSIRTLDDLADMPRWVAWREEKGINKKTGKAEFKKMPYNPSTGFAAKSNDPETWDTLREAEKRWLKLRRDDDTVGGVGINLGDLGCGVHLLGIDLDRCIEDNVLTPWADEIVGRFNTYTEVSSGLKGVKLFFLISADDAATVAEMMPKDKAGKALTRKVFAAGEHHEIALDRGRYYTVTSNCLEGECQELRRVSVDDVKWLLDDAGPRFKQQFAVTNGDNAPSDGLYPSGSEAGFNFLIECKKRGDSYEVAKQALLADQGQAGEWARRKEERDFQMAWDKITVNVPIHSWDDPDISLLDDRRGELPAFPLKALQPKWLRNFIRRAAHGAGVSVDSVVIPFLGIASGLIGRSRMVTAGSDWVQPCTLWAALVGLSGDGKTSGILVSRKALVTTNEHLQDDNEAKRRNHDKMAIMAKAKHDQYKDDVKKAFKAHKEPPEAPDLPTIEEFIAEHLYVNDVTVEKMAVLAKARPQGMILLVGELAGWFTNMGRYAKGDDRAFWLAAWDGEDFNQHRMEREVRVKNLLVGVLGGLQPDRVAEVFRGAHDGAYARFLFSWPENASYRPLRTGKQEQLDEEIVPLFKRLSKIRKADKVGIPLSVQALAEFETFRQQVKAELPSLDGRERDWYAKAEAQVLRLSGTLRLLQWATAELEQGKKFATPKLIKRVTVKAAIRLVQEYFWPHAKASLRQIELSQQAANERKVLRWVVAKGVYQFRREEIRRQALTMRVNADQTEAILNNLAKAGWLRKVELKTGKPGRPQVLWDVNPKLFPAGFSMTPLDCSQEG